WLPINVRLRYRDTLSLAYTASIKAEAMAWISLGDRSLSGEGSASKKSKSSIVKSAGGQGFPVRVKRYRCHLNRFSPPLRRQFPVCPVLSTLPDPPQGHPRPVYAGFPPGTQPVIACKLCRSTPKRNSKRTILNFYVDLKLMRALLS